MLTLLTINKQQILSEFREILLLTLNNN